MKTSVDAAVLTRFARPTAAWRLKDNEIHRTVNDQMRLFKAIEVSDLPS